MGVVRTRGNTLVLVRNHENQPGPLLYAPDGAGFVYDDASLSGLRFGGGTTTLVYDRLRGWRRSQASLAGTVANCAGGITPWGTWISCEEFIIDGSSFNGQRHGYAFEVGPFSKTTGRPIRDMGVMAHEAAVVDASTGIVYETEDEGPNSGFYRYLPNRNKMRHGQLEKGGTLQMLGVVDQPGADLRAPQQGEEFDVTWAPIAEPDRLPPGGGIVLNGPSVPYMQGRSAGGARFDRLEGCFYDPFEGAVYFADTRGGAGRVGAIWRYVPPANELTGNGRLTAIFVGRDESAIDLADNLTVSPRGGLLVCEDGNNGAGTNTGLRMMGVTGDGCSYEFAVNNILLDETLPGRPDIRAGDYRSMEWCGACFDPMGGVLFANVQTPGVTFAITGPFALGPL
jgi:secreted PhoX family phosphatase